MIKFASILCFVLLSCGVSADTIRLSEPVSQDDQSETFGIVLNTALPSLSMANLVNHSDKYLGKPFQLTTRIAKVCQKKGCFFIAQQDQYVLRVSFRDYSFFIPTDSSGKTVTLAGELIQKEMSPEQLAHFKTDLGGKSGLKAGSVFEIVADSVRIPRG